MDIATLRDFSGIVTNVTTTIALVFGGVWTYFRFLRGRTFSPRLEIAIEGTVSDFGDAACIRVGVKVRNVGLSRIAIAQKGTGILFSTYPKDHYRAVTHQAIWGNCTAFPLLENHDSIEPQEEVNEVVLIAVSTQGVIAWKLEALLFSPKRAFRERVLWSASAIVFNQRDEIAGARADETATTPATSADAAGDCASRLTAAGAAAAAATTDARTTTATSAATR
jgi:hypothetical protein